MDIVDLHTHGIGGLDTRSADSDTVLRIAARHGEAGVSAILLSLYPAPTAIMRARMAAVKEAMERQYRAESIERRAERVSSESPVSKTQNPKPKTQNCPPAARILGVHLEGPFLNPQMHGALDPAAFLAPDEKPLRELTEGFEGTVRTMTVAPEIPGALAIIKMLAEQSIIVNMGHSGATYAEAEAGFRAGARGITHLFNAMRGFHHREPGIVGFGLLSHDVYVEMVGDLKHLAPETIDLIFRMKDADRILLVSDSVAQTGCTRGRVLEAEDRRLTGGSMDLKEAAETLVARGFDKEIVTRSVTTNPREYLARA